MRISVYIPSFNQRSFLSEAVESVLAQTLAPHQLILIDDASTDGSQDVIADYAARHPRLIAAIYRDQNQGIPRTRNQALAAVTGDCVTYVDADDRLLPTKLACEAAALKACPDAQIAFSDFYISDASGTVLRQWSGESKPPAGYVFRETILRRFPRGTLFRKELVRYDVFHRVGGYETSLKIYSDWELRIRMTKQCRTVYVDRPLSEYRRHGAGVSTAPLAEHVQAWQQIWRKNCGLLDDLPPAERLEIEREFGALIERKRQEPTPPGKPVQAGCERVSIRNRLGADTPHRGGKLSVLLHRASRALARLRAG